MVEKGLHLAIGVGLTGVITHQVVVYHILVHFRRERGRERESHRGRVGEGGRRKSVNYSLAQRSCYVYLYDTHSTGNAP